MAKAFRYALATFCFAASVGCLALWWRSMYRWDVHEWLTKPPFCGQILQTIDGMAAVEVNHKYSYAPSISRSYFHTPNRANGQLSGEFEKHGQFCVSDGRARFPLWYPTLTFTLAGIAALRLGRRFTLRSVMIATTVVAVLMGMAVIL